MKGLGADQPYWQGLEKGELHIQQCPQCETWHVPAVWRCGECGNWDLQWQQKAIAGVIYSWTRTWHNFGAPAEIELPYLSVVVEIDNAGGRRMMGVLDGDAQTPVAIGDRVSGSVYTVTVDGESVPALRWQRCVGNGAGESL
ncbi:OB-fold domain-containing protein [Spongiibacter taiwanensis]|uniref:Zn-ribbon domain-containing OB-fold protein n=1 Tax=Spongiibacter taiwanensis TaxID=1748242 RepID=UPI002035A0DC|nr:OB-fold domain-containing protein [Spongiibacter taiwanensis]USA42871.1 OB-fold domain-containing protein [Spongiibacter taiwanensis]